MTKDQFIYLVQNYLGGGSAPTDIKKKYRKGIISVYIGMVFNDAIVKIAAVDLDSLNSYVKVYPVCTIVNDAILGKKYIVVPTTSTKKILQIPNNKAIREVYLNTTTTTKLTYRPLGADSVYSGLEVNSYISEPRYDLLGERIYFSVTHMAVAPYLTVTTALVKMIVPWSEFASNEDVPMPFESDEALFIAVVNKLRGLPPEDKIIDQNVVQQEIK